MPNIAELTRLGDASIITLHTAHKLRANANDWRTPSVTISLHPDTREEYSAIVAGVRAFYHEIDCKIYECASYHTREDVGVTFGTTDFYFTAKEAADNHGRVELTVFWP